MAGVAGVGVEVELPGLVKTSPMVLRCAASGVLGMYSAPLWPQAASESDMQASAAQAINTLVLFLLPCSEYVFFIDLILLLFNIPSIVMTDLEFLDQAESALKAIESHCDRINDAGDADIDNQRTGGMITLTFENKSQIVVNLQKPLQEIWLATKRGGYHYKFVHGQWQDTKSAAELFANLSDCASEQAQSTLVFSSF